MLELRPYHKTHRVAASGISKIARPQVIRAWIFVSMGRSQLSDNKIPPYSDCLTHLCCERWGFDKAFVSNVPVFDDTLLGVNAFAVSTSALWFWCTRF
jgi:hypothetical protein